MSSDPHERRPPEFEELVASIQKTPIATIITDNSSTDNPILATNSAFLDLTGYRREEVVGRNCRFLAGPATEPEVRQSVRSAVERGEPIVAEMTNYRKDGSTFRNAVMIAPVRDEAGKISFFIGSQMDVGATQGASGLRQSRSAEVVGGLTPRLSQVLAFMAVGYRNKQIAGELGIGEKTVKMHRARLKKALGVPTSADAIRIALEAGLIPIDPGSPRNER